MESGLYGRCEPAAAAQATASGLDAVLLQWVYGSPNMDKSHSDYGQYGDFSCYQTYDWNDMASALGITPFAAATVPCAYIGYQSFGWTGDYRYDGVGGGPIPGIAITSWDTMANGYSFEFTRNWIRGGFPPYRQPDPDQPGTLSSEIQVAPFYNWRFWGNNNVSPF